MDAKRFTAVQSLDILLLGVISFDSEVLRNKYKEALAFALAMEKEQIIDAYAQGFIESESMDKGAEQYYKETYGK
jgi:hypothetical protein